MQYKNVELYNIQALVDSPDSGDKLLSRLPEAVRAQLNPTAQTAALSTCGCEIRFRLDGPAATVTLRRRASPDVSPFGVAEVYRGAFQDSYQVCPALIGPEPTPVTVMSLGDTAFLQTVTERNGLPYDPALVRIILPYDAPTLLCDIAGDVAPPRPEQAPARRLLAYGSSLTHGGSAIRPTETFAMETARLLGMDLINLGFAGSAQMDTAVADYIAERPDWDMATLELGVNVFGLWPLEQFADQVNVFLDRIAAGSGGRPVFCTDILPLSGDIAGSEYTERYRKAVREAAEARQPHIHWVPGRDLLSFTGLSVDGVHPSAAGMREIAGNLSRAIQARTGS